MRGKVKEFTRHVDAVLKALDVLDCFQVHPLLPLKKISELTGMNKSRIIRLCGTLASRGYLVYDSESLHYKLGSRILALSKIYEQSNNLISLARPVLGYLARQTGESATLYVVDGLKRLCLAREEGTFSIRFNIMEGERMALYAGAGGKLLLAFGPEELRRKVLRKAHLRPLTPSTIRDPKRLEKELETIRRQDMLPVTENEMPKLRRLPLPFTAMTGRSVRR